MNISHSIYWRIREYPSSETVVPLEYQHIDLHEDVPIFVITLPICLSDSVDRVFPGGTLLSLLHFIYEFYQEPVTTEELVRVMLLSPFNRNHNRMIGLGERQGAGEIIRRINILGSSATYEEIEEGVLIVDI